MSPSCLDQAPAVQMTVSVLMVPRLVSTAVMVAPSVEMSVTGQPRSRRAPARRAPLAYPRTTDSGVQCPSFGDHAAASSPEVSMSGESRLASATSIIRLVTPSSFCSATFFSNASTWWGWSSRNR